MPDETVDEVLEMMRVDCEGERSLSWYREHIEAALARRDAAHLEVAKMLGQVCPECEGARGDIGEHSGIFYQCGVCSGTGFFPIERAKLAARIREIVAGEKEEA